MATKFVVLIVTVCVLLSIVKSRGSPRPRPRTTGRPQGVCMKRVGRCLFSLRQAAMTGDCRAFSVALIKCVREDHVGDDAAQRCAGNLVSRVTQYVCRCTQMLRNCKSGIQTHQHFCQQFQQAVGCSFEVVQNQGCRMFNHYVAGDMVYYQDIYYKTCKDDGCGKLFERWNTAAKCYDEFKQTVRGDKCSAQEAMIQCAETNFKDCKFLLDKYGDQLNYLKANHTRDCPTASGRRGFEFLDAGALERVFGGSRAGLDEAAVEKLLRGIQYEEDKMVRGIRDEEEEKNIHKMDENEEDLMKQLMPLLG